MSLKFVNQHPLWIQCGYYFKPKVAASHLHRRKVTKQLHVFFVTVPLKTRKALKISVMIGALAFGMCIVGVVMTANSIKMQGRYQIIGSALIILGVTFLASSAVWCFKHRKSITAIKREAGTGWHDFGANAGSRCEGHVCYVNAVAYGGTVTDARRNYAANNDERCPPYEACVADLPPTYVEALQIHDVT